MDFFLSQAIPQVRSGVDADDTVTSWFPEGEALEISERSSPGGRRTLSHHHPHRRTLQGSVGLASTIAAAFWVCRHPRPGSCSWWPLPPNMSSLVFLTFS